MDFTYGLNYSYTRDGDLLGSARSGPSFCFFDSHAKWQPSTVFLLSCTQIWFPPLLLLSLPLHPARPRIEDDDAVQFLSTVLVSGQIQLNMFPTARPFFSLVLPYFPRTNPIRLLSFCPQMKSPLMLTSLGICFPPLSTSPLYPSVLLFSAVNFYTRNAGELKVGDVIDTGIWGINWRLTLMWVVMLLVKQI